MEASRRAALYSRKGTCIKLMLVSPHAISITEDGLVYLLRSEIAGLLRFHEVDPADQAPELRYIITQDDLRFLRSLRIAWEPA